MRAFFLFSSLFVKSAQNWVESKRAAIVQHPALRSLRVVTVPRGCGNLVVVGSQHFAVAHTLQKRRKESHYTLHRRKRQNKVTVFTFLERNPDYKDTTKKRTIGSVD